VLDAEARDIDRLRLTLSGGEDDVKPSRVVCVAATVLAFQGIGTTTRASDQDAIIARLNALEKENTALRQRLNRIERAGATSKYNAPHAASRQSPPGASELETPRATAALMDTRASGAPRPNVYKSPEPWIAPRHFELEWQREFRLRFSEI
jgi:hypothetical protein